MNKFLIAAIALTLATPALAQGMAPRVRVNAVGPGPTLRNERQSEADFDRQRHATLLGDGADPADICAAVRYLLDAASVTGQESPWTMRPRRAKASSSPARTF